MIINDNKIFHIHSYFRDCLPKDIYGNKPMGFEGNDGASFWKDYCRFGLCLAPFGVFFL